MGRVAVKGEDDSFTGSGWTTAVVVCEKNLYYMHFYLPTNTQKIEPHTIGIEKIDYRYFS